ncbi:MULTISPECIES: hypothetical protein [unclassified Clostridium]|uniref:hypothetical protein n=1 Tax=unclassified Clostridium TaxID=2614128 RepID=UPI0002976CE6|nr:MULTISPECIES: hypothetical protein [unclassified Clostridium]EKQ53079.1 MAG: hypothetical protein A370_03931 [Clostridium sp. Maddingley MBC34-26]
MEKVNEELGIRNTVTIEDKQILRKALDGINGWSFNPVAVVNDGREEYYFICKVKTMVENFHMKMVKVYIKIQEEGNPKLLSIEEIV